MLYVAEGTRKKALTDDELELLLVRAFRAIGPRKRVLIIPPDITRMHSRAGMITEIAWRYYGNSLKGILPALGTHTPMSPAERRRMFPGVPEKLFLDHDWRNEVVTLGEIPQDRVAALTSGAISFSWPVQVNRILVDGAFDLILSVGQVVPHEVIGMANYTKNIFVGTGGEAGIHRSHFVGAVCGMERIMGEVDTPVRALLDEAFSRFARNMPVVFIHTVIRSESSDTRLCGLYVGDDRSVFEQAAALSKQVNITRVAAPLGKVVVYLDPSEYRSTWLGNKAIYRTRMAMASGGELIILAPGVKCFGEDPAIDRLIRKYGYSGRDTVLAHVEREPELQQNLAAAAHLIHGSSEGRFTVTYCPGNLTEEEIRSVGYRYGSIDAMLSRYSPDDLRDGIQDSDGENVYYIANPALGLWKA